MVEKAPEATSCDAPLRIGLIADIQYADKDDGTDFSGREKRHFRNALKIAARACDCWNKADVDLVVQLGDIIDGCNRQMGQSKEALEKVLGVLQQCRAEQRFDLIGNHELYNINRCDLATSGLNCMDSEGKTYFSVDLNAHWRAIFLDPYEHALIGLPETDTGYVMAAKLMEEHNPKVLTGDRDWFKGLPEHLHRYVPFNGGVSDAQVEWLEAALAETAKSERSALVFCHVPLCERATKPKTVVWNAEALLQVIHKHRESVAAVIAGHDHNGGYAVDEAGIHHVTMNSPLTAEPESDCCAVLECYVDGTAKFIGHGRACVESGTSGAGKSYPVLRLCKGAENEAIGPKI